MLRQRKTLTPPHLNGEEKVQSPVASIHPLSSAALLVAVIAVTFVLWGTNGPAYLVDLIAAYCFL